MAIPPDHLWGPVQGRRKQYDRHYRRWMPHITLLYPFRPVSAFEQVVPLLAQALCAGWQAIWQPLAFTLSHVYLIWRNDPPDDVFRMGPVLTLGGQ